MEKTMKARVQHKHDIEVNWLKAMNFIPLASEIIVYDPDENYDYPRIKIGDGETNINALPFVTKDYAKTSDIPTKPADIGAQPAGNYLTSIPSEYVTETELSNKGFLTSYTETDPTVPAWAKASSKPSYTKSEVGLDNVDNVKQYSTSNPPVVVQLEVPTDTSVIWVDPSDNTMDEMPNGGNADFVVSDTPPEDTSVLWVDPTDDTEDGSTGIAVTGAKVGQTVKIAEVDENGVPTAWEAVEFPSEGAYERIETITITEEVNSIYRDLPKCKALLVKYTIPAVTSVIHLFSIAGFDSGSKFSITLTLNTLNTTLGARTEIYPQNGYYAGTGYLPSSSYSNAGTAIAIPNHSAVVVKDTNYINSFTLTGYSEKNIPVGTKIEFWGVKVNG